MSNNILNQHSQHDKNEHHHIVNDRISTIFELCCIPWVGKLCFPSYLGCEKEFEVGTYWLNKVISFCKDGLPDQYQRNRQIHDQVYVEVRLLYDQPELVDCNDLGWIGFSWFEVFLTSVGQFRGE